MASVDPATGRPLPADAIQRVLFVAPKVHVYNIPPLTSTRGYTAAAWTENNNARLIFTARLRVLETAIPDQNGGETVKTDVLLEDPKDGQLFAAAPYTTPAAVEQVLDSSRFFAVTVVGGDRGQKAVLGIGFEERGDAFDFGVSLQEVRRVNGMDKAGQEKGRRAPGRGAAPQEKPVEKKDFSLKEGETITVNIGGRGRRARNETSTPTSSTSEQAALFSIAPPPGTASSNAMPFLPPPPSAHAVKHERRRSKHGAPQESSPQPSAAELGFDDGEFGEFQ